MIKAFRDIEGEIGADARYAAQGFAARRSALAGGEASAKAEFDSDVAGMDAETAREVALIHAQAQEELSAILDDESLSESEKKLRIEELQRSVVFLTRENTELREQNEL